MYRRELRRDPLVQEHSTRVIPPSMSPTRTPGSLNFFNYSLCGAELFDALGKIDLRNELMYDNIAWLAGTGIESRRFISH